MSEQLQTCWSCHMPQPPDYRQSLHLEECPEHDEETCTVCVQEEADEAEAPPLTGEGS